MNVLVTRCCPSHHRCISRMNALVTHCCPSYHRCISRMEAVDFKQRMAADGVQFVLFNAGHVLGAAMVLIEIAGVRILYTGDYR